MSKECQNTDDKKEYWNGIPRGEDGKADRLYDGKHIKGIR